MYFFLLNILFLNVLSTVFIFLKIPEEGDKEQYLHLDSLVKNFDGSTIPGFSNAVENKDYLGMMSPPGIFCSFRQFHEISLKNSVKLKFCNYLLFIGLQINLYVKNIYRAKFRCKI